LLFLKKIINTGKPYLIPRIFISFHNKLILGLDLFPIHPIFITSLSRICKIRFQGYSDLADWARSHMTLKAKYDTEQTVIFKPFSRIRWARSHMTLMKATNDA
jgi:hypothetical protein